MAYEKFVVPKNFTVCQSLELLNTILKNHNDNLIQEAQSLNTSNSIRKWGKMLKKVEKLEDYFKESITTIEKKFKVENILNLSEQFNVEVHAASQTMLLTVDDIRETKRKTVDRIEDARNKSKLGIFAPNPTESIFDSEKTKHKRRAKQAEELAERIDAAKIKEERQEVIDYQQYLKDEEEKEKQQAIEKYIQDEVERRLDAEFNRRVETEVQLRVEVAIQRKMEEIMGMTPDRHYPLDEKKAYATDYKAPFETEPKRQISSGFGDDYETEQEINQKVLIERRREELKQEQLIRQKHMAEEQRTRYTPITNSLTNNNDLLYQVGSSSSTPQRSVTMATRPISYQHTNSSSITSTSVSTGPYTPTLPPRSNSISKKKGIPPVSQQQEFVPPPPSYDTSESIHNENQNSSGSQLNLQHSTPGITRTQSLYSSPSTRIPSRPGTTTTSTNNYSTTTTTSNDHGITTSTTTTTMTPPPISNGLPPRLPKRTSMFQSSGPDSSFQRSNTMNSSNQEHDSYYPPPTENRPFNYNTLSSTLPKQ
ncbi:hypothetical protein TBLA_0B04595 [Henningerozyma blattae CBS 6284]|uniref:Uncharacterized protein n=1 Tax=Henningerozyma blattae (strain ATCC 34711 / CBS 6284 / DSM 70876 / NBRC 10599 / NRRL Y-10934 / UCD 77-7) TaxID=1071380 RepID=I2GYU4_HENB6|nr:hypothetical protein TBLA_0B04595 [Tetrapisispora blattae CBS 6284]CCH59296.1 hypothetical protein TBLA_0B04595 [Tetrapisispora blattae CBS 6284]